MTWRNRTDLSFVFRTTTGSIGLALEFVRVHTVTKLYSPMTILVLDDEPASDIVSRVLRCLGPDVVTAANGRLDLVEEFVPLGRDGALAEMDQRR